MELVKVKKFLLAKLKKELPRSLSYHSTEHTKDVYNSARLLARMENIKGEDLTLLLTATLFHDSGFLWQPYEHEQISCEIAMKYLPEYDYSPDQIERICGMIKATKIPQDPHNKLEELICDADLDYLGREDFLKIGNWLYKELCMYGILESEDEWNSTTSRSRQKNCDRLKKMSTLRW
jgi:uncharacterized protein